MQPREFAQLLLASTNKPPRARARDQQADRAGEALRREILERLAEADPSAAEMETALARIVEQTAPPRGPTRAIAINVLQEWRDVSDDPQLLEHFLHRATRHGHA